MGWKKDMMAVGESLGAGSKAVGKWSIADMTIGLSYLMEERAKQLKDDPQKKVRALKGCGKVDSVKRLETFEWACDLAEIAYIGDESVMRKLLQEMGFTLVHGEVQSKFAVPAHYWAYDREQKRCVFAVRGTVSKKDMLTDLDSYPEDFGPYKVHRGMMQSARALAEKVAKPLQDLAQEGFCITVVGHSLGAGTSALLSILLRTEYHIKDLTCFAIAPPPVADSSLCQASRSYIHSLVCNDDIVCRLSSSNVKRINQEVLGLPWRSMAASDFSQATRTGAIAQSLGVKMGEFQARMPTTAKMYNQASGTVSYAAGKAAGTLTAGMTKGMTKGMSMLGLKGSSGKKNQNQAQQQEDHAVTLLPPGNIVFLFRSGGDEGKDDISPSVQVKVQAYDIDQSWEGLNRIELSYSMLQDHYLTSYFNCLKLAMERPVEVAQVVLANEKMLKLEAGKKNLIGMAEWKERKVSLLKLRRKHFLIEYVSKGNKIKVVRLGGAHVSKQLKMSKRPFAFSIAMPDKTVKLDPVTKEERERWLAALGTLLPIQ